MPALAGSRIDSVRVVNMLSGAATRIRRVSSRRVSGSTAGERLYTTIGGNAPQWLVNRAADDLAAGRRRAVLIAGGEALHTLRLASKQRVDCRGHTVAGVPPMIGDDRQGLASG